MSKETIKFLWEIYNTLNDRQNEPNNDYGIDVSDVVIKLKERIDLELKD